MLEWRRNRIINRRDKRRKIIGFDGRRKKTKGVSKGWFLLIDASRSVVDQTMMLLNQELPGRMTRRKREKAMVERKNRNMTKRNKIRGCTLHNVER